MTIIFAELSAEGWAVIIGAVFLGVSQITAMILSHLRAVKLAAKVEGCKEEIKEATVNQYEKVKKSVVDEFKKGKPQIDPKQVHHAS